MGKNKLTVHVDGRPTIVSIVKKVPGKFTGITLWPVGIYIENDPRLFMGKPKKLENGLNEVSLSTYADELIRHELIHWEQQKETLGIVFYLWYFFEWLFRVITQPWNTAYADISFELEANAYEKDPEYLENRKGYEWIKFVGKNKEKV